MTMNNRNVSLANTALQAYVVELGDEEALTDEQWMEGLMTDIRHLCDAQGWDHGKMQKAAHRLYQQDLADDKPANADFAEGDDQ